MEDKLNSYILEQVNALNCLSREEIVIPSLMIIYATIDNLGFVTAEDEAIDSGKRFRSFVDNYMIKYLEDVTSYDLWGARCAVLHTGTPESTHSARGEAREILYSWGAADSSINKQIISESADKYVAITLETLANGLMDAMCDVQDIFASNSGSRQLWKNRIKRLYCRIDQ